MKPLSFTKVAIRKFAELKDTRGVQFIAAETAQTDKNLLIAKQDGQEIVLAVDDENLRAFAYEILGKIGRAHN